MLHEYGTVTIFSTTHGKSIRGDFNLVNFNFEGVKLTFYAPPRKAIPSMQRIHHFYTLFNTIETEES